jgi:hypothetical protein
MVLRRIFPRLIAPLAGVVLVVTLLVSADGRDVPMPPRVRPNPNIAPFQGMGVVEIGIQLDRYRNNVVGLIRLGQPAFVGWPNQIRDEPGVMLWGERSWRKQHESENNVSHE